MNNNNNMMTSLLTLGATGAIIYGVTRGLKNGTFKRLQQPISNAIKNPQVQQLMQPLQGMTGQQGTGQSFPISQNQTSNNQNQMQ